MKIVIVSSSYPPQIMGGGEISTRSLALMLSDMGYEVYSISFSDNASRELDGKVNVIRLKPIVLHSLYYSGDVNTVKKILWRLREEYSPVLAKQVMSIVSDIKPELILTSTIEDVSTYFWKTASLRGLKVVHILRSYYLLCWRGSMFKKGVNCEKRCIDCRLINRNKIENSKYVSGVVGISQSVLDIHLRNGLFRNINSYIIDNDCNDIVANVVDDGCDFNIDSGCYIGYLGRVHPTKGVEDIILALNLSNVRDCTTLLIGGEGDETYVGVLKDMAEGLGVNIRFLGYTKPEKLLKLVDFLVVPSKWHEPFGRVVVESILFDVPVFVRNAGGMPELIDSSCGAVFEDYFQLSTLLNEFYDGRFEYDFSIKDRYSKNSIMNSWKGLINDVTTK
jgi:glycosyltransferase involved in cell wall biosynthesis